MEYLLPESVRGLVFDCDGTLLDTMSSHWASWQAACEKFGLLMTSEDFLGFAGKLHVILRMNHISMAISVSGEVQHTVT
jgi:beta-phosphoglucomutase-like phosphatase (HAD superfamily)